MVDIYYSSIIRQPREAIYVFPWELSSDAGSSNHPLRQPTHPLDLT